MNTTPFPGHGMARTLPGIPEFQEREREAAADDEAFADAVSEVLEQQKEPVTDRGIFERSIANRRAEKARQQAIAAAANTKIRALTLSIRAMEDALDGLVSSEA